MRFSRFAWMLLAVTVLISPRGAWAANISDFVTYSLTDNNSTLLPGLLHIPVEYASDPTVPRPLILFLHGSGESGTDNRRQINGNIDNLLAAAKSRGAFLYAPQTNIGWASTTLLSHAMTMMDRSIGEFNVDTSRLYVTGLSMGGGGVWNFLNQYPDRVAAAVPICAIGPSANFLPANIVNEPIWAFHGRSDRNVPVEVTRSVVNSLLTEAGQPIPDYPPTSDTFGPDVKFDFPPLDLHYTDMRGSHDIWFRVYNTPAMYDWLFTRGLIPEPGTLTLALVGLIVWGGRRRYPSKLSALRSMRSTLSSSVSCGFRRG